LLREWNKLGCWKSWYLLGNRNRTWFEWFDLCKLLGSCMQLGFKVIVINLFYILKVSQHYTFYNLYNHNHNRARLQLKAMITKYDTKSEALTSESNPPMLTWVVVSTESFTLPSKSMLPIICKFKITQIEISTINHT